MPEAKLPGVKKRRWGRECFGYFEETSSGRDSGCEYQPDFTCDQCVFVVGEQTGDYRKGKRPGTKREDK